MIATRFDYLAPEDLAELREVMRGGATVLGGGTWVVPELSAGVRAPERLVDLRRLGIDRVEPDGEDLAVGAMTTYAALLRTTGSDCGLRLLRRMASGVTGGPQLRNVGTVGGSAAYATPSSEVPAVLTALGAELLIVGPESERAVAAAAFFVDAFATCLDEDEVLVGIRLPALAPERRVGYIKLKLSESSYPIATAAAHAELAGDGTILDCCLVVGAACPVPVEVPVSDLVVGCTPAEAAPLVADRAREVCDVPYDDVLADAGYRREIAGVAARRAVAQLGEDA